MREVQQLDGVVFDVDGVLFDTERLTEKIWIETSRAWGKPQLGDNYLDYVGRNRTDILDKLAREIGPDFPGPDFLLYCSRAALAQMEREGVPVKPGAREMLEYLHAHNVPTALATSSGRERTVRLMELTGLDRYFSAMITGDQVEHSKPHPQIYRLACRALDTAPARTLAVEDSRNGILSAYAAGMPVAMVPDMIPPAPELEEKLWRRCGSLLELRDVLASRDK